ncbi:MAG: serine O-acetyltransferase, partial [Rivularia sp. ALOHA_DT_140]|nr:serine O-acetyltransferase [Rivularia sp. ALOHA_DT_140]
MPQSDEHIDNQFAKNAVGTNTSASENQIEANFITLLRHDFRLIFERDPAARNWLEVLLCYPGFHALCLHRLANWLHRRQINLIPRLISHFGR